MRWKSCSELARDEVCPEEQRHCWADEGDSCTESARVSVFQTLVITTTGQFFTQHSDDVIQSQHAPSVHEDTGPAVLSMRRVNTHLHLCRHLRVHGLIMQACTHMCTQTSTHTVTFLQIHTQTHPLPHTQTHQPCVQNFWLCCLWVPLFSGKGLAVHKHPSVCLYKLLGCAKYTWVLMSESTLCRLVCPSNSAKVVDKIG